MARRTECYVDTAAFIALADTSDSYHSLFRTLFADPPRLIASALVIAEAHGWFLRRYDQQKALQFLTFLNEVPTLGIEAFDAPKVGLTAAILERFKDQKLTLADAHGLAIMKDRRIEICWSTDWHMSLMGVTLATATASKSRRYRSAEI